MVEPGLGLSALLIEPSDIARQCGALPNKGC